MNVIKVEDLPNLAYCSSNLFLDNNYIILSPDVPILPDFKKRLLNWKYDSIFSQEEPVFTKINSKNDAEAILTKKDNHQTIQEREASDFFIEVCDFIEKIFTNFRKGKPPVQSIVASQVKNIMRMLKTHKNYLLNFSLLEFDDIDYSITQSVKTTILTVAMGEILGIPVHKLILLGTAAILHRIGAVQIPQELFYSDDKLTKEQKRSLSLFPLLGFRGLKAVNFPISITLAILEHRENMDGSGYPRGITGDKISFYGKIISVSSAFCAIVSNRPNRKRMTPHYGMMALIKEKNIKYDEKVIRILLLTLTLYPIGTYVLLSDGSIGLVIETDSEKPKYPVLRLMFDYKMIYFADEPKIKTYENSDIFIERALTIDEVEEIEEKIPK